MTQQQLKIRELVNHTGPEGVYQMVLDGTIGKFPNGFWGMPENKVYKAQCIRYLIEVRLKWSREQVCKGFSLELLRNNKLGTLCSKKHGMGSHWSLLDNAYPGEFKPWELARISDNLWTKESVRQALRWMIEDKLGWDLETVKKNMSVEVVCKYNLYGLVVQKYNSCLAMAMVDYYGYDKLKPWELSKAGVPTRYWNKKTAREAMCWLINDKLKWDIDDVRKNFGAKELIDNKLIGLLGRYGNDSIYDLVKLVYGDDIKQWELVKVANNYWGNDTNNTKEIAALKESRLKLGWTKDEYKSKINVKLLSDLGLRTLTQKYRLDDIRKMIDKT